MFMQSSVLEHAELHLLLSMITPLGWLERVPTYKERSKTSRTRTWHVRLPRLSGAADRGHRDVRRAGAGVVVPVGEDQVSHVELTREIVRRFNTHFGLAIDRNGLFDEESSAR